MSTTARRRRELAHFRHVHAELLTGRPAAAQGSSGPAEPEPEPNPAEHEEPERAPALRRQYWPCGLCPHCHAPGVLCGASGCRCYA